MRLMPVTNGCSEIRYQPSETITFPGDQNDQGKKDNSDDYGIYPVHFRYNLTFKEGFSPVRSGYLFSIGMMYNGNIPYVYTTHH